MMNKDENIYIMAYVIKKGRLCTIVAKLLEIIRKICLQKLKSFKIKRRKRERMF